MVDVDRVRSNLGTLEEYLRGLADKQNCTKEEYLGDRDLRDIVERRFEKAIRASLDIAAHVVASEGYREPEDYGDLFRILEEESVLSPEVAARMVSMAGFRNVLAHEYSDIDDEIVHDNLQDLEHFRSFAEEIDRFLSRPED